MRAIALLGLALMGLAQAGLTRAALVDNGNGLIYDTTLHATWLQDGNTFATQFAADPDLVDEIIAAVPVVNDTPNAYDNGRHTLGAGDFSFGKGSDGSMTWWGARAWVEYLNDIDYKGSNHWALPISDTCGGFNCTNSQLGELYYGELGGVADVGLSTMGPFSNLKTVIYWSSNEDGPNPFRAWAFETFMGSQYPSPKPLVWYAEALTPGDVGAVPEPAAAILLALGLGGGVAIRRMRFPCRR